jgi:dTDP-4-dehydrorhamnose 3,5-epimerase
VDLRRGSPTFGKWHGVVLSAENKRQFFVPAGFAHGFQVLSETTLFSYKCDAFYSPKDECTLAWNDPAVGIPWPLPDPLLSEKDGRGYKLADLAPEKLFTWSEK